MKNLLVITLMIACTAMAQAATIRDKVLVYFPGLYLAGQVIPLGVDPYGYNYQAHSFAGSHFNSYANAAGLPPYSGDDAAYLAANPTAASHWAWPYRNHQLAMKWNEAWLSNSDKDNDGMLDRHYGFASYIGSGAWLTNHSSGEYAVGDKEYNWNDFAKIVAVPPDAIRSGVVWLDSSGKEIGLVIWGEFALAQEVPNDSGPGGSHGLLYSGFAGPGLGKY